MYPKTILPMTILVTVLISCDDEETPLGRNVISYTDGQLRSNAWIIYSDANGKVLYTEAYQNSNTFYFDKLVDTTVTITTVQRNVFGGTTSWFLTTLTHVSMGTYVKTPPSFNEHTPSIGVHKVFIPTRSNYHSFHVTSDKFCDYPYANVDGSEIHVGLCEQRGKLYATFQETAGSVSKYLFKDINIGEQTTFDEAMLNSFAEQQSHTFHVDGAVSYSASIVASNRNSGIRLFEGSASGSALAIYYPGAIPDGLFTSYTTILYVRDGQAASIDKEISDAMDLVFTPLNVELEEVERNGFPEFHFTAGGQADYFEAVLEEYATDRGVTWHVYGKYGHGISFILPNLNGVFKTTVATSALKCERLMFVNDAARKTYRGYYRSQLDAYVPEDDMQWKIYFIED